MSRRTKASRRIATANWIASVETDAAAERVVATLQTSNRVLQRTRGNPADRVARLEQLAKAVG